MPSCCIKKCFNRTGIKENNANGVFFYQFPSPDKSPERFSKWMKFAGSPNYCRYIRLCSYHFEPKDMDERQLLRQKLLREIGEKVSGPSLKPDAVPSLKTTDLPRKCFVKDCPKDCSKQTFPNRLHSPERFKKWVSFCNQELLPGIKAGICKHHFQQEDFEEDLEGVKVLKKGTVPTRTDSVLRPVKNKSRKSKSIECSSIKTDDIESLRQTRLSQEKETSSKETSNKKVDIALTSKSIVNSETCDKSIKKSSKITLKDDEFLLTEENETPSIPMNGFVCLPSKGRSLLAIMSKDRQNINAPTVKPTIKYSPEAKKKRWAPIQVSNEKSKNSKLFLSVIRRIEEIAEANNRISMNKPVVQSEIIKEPSGRIQVKPLHLLINPPGDKKAKYKENTEEVLSVKREYIKNDLQDIDKDNKTGILETLRPIKEETGNLESSTEHLKTKEQTYTETFKMETKPIDRSDFKIEAIGGMETDEIEIKEEPLPIWFQ